MPFLSCLLASACPPALDTCHRPVSPPALRSKANLRSRLHVHGIPGPPEHRSPRRQLGHPLLSEGRCTCLASLPTAHTVWPLRTLSFGPLVFPHVCRAPGSHSPSPAGTQGESALRLFKGSPSRGPSRASHLAFPPCLQERVHLFALHQITPIGARKLRTPPTPRGTTRPSPLAISSPAASSFLYFLQ